MNSIKRSAQHKSGRYYYLRSGGEHLGLGRGNRKDGMSQETRCDWAAGCCEVNRGADAPSFPTKSTVTTSNHCGPMRLPYQLSRRCWDLAASLGPVGIFGRGTQQHDLLDGQHKLAGTAPWPDTLSTLQRLQANC